MRRVVITGIGVISPVGNTREEFWKSLINGKSGIGTITKFDASGYAVRIAGEVKDFDPGDILSPKERRRTDLFTQYALTAAHEALSDAGIEVEKIDRDRVGVIVASGIGGTVTWEAQHRKLLEQGPDRVSPLFIPMMIINTASGMIAIRYRFRGPNFAVVSACASSGHAIGEAMRKIQYGEADVMITGGTEASITPLSVAGFSVMKALSTRNDEPERASRPFDRERDGFVMAEGCAIIVLEELEHAKRRGAKIYAELAGYGASDDAYHITAPDESGEGPALSMIRAIEDAGRKPEDVDYINAHGTSTPLNDKIETLAIKKVFGERAKDIPVSSIKSMVGHLLGAASAVELAATALTIRDGIIPPTINYENPDPECDLDYVPNEARKKEVKFALSNSFGFGGHNVTLALAKYEEGG
ncbi:beta-ketoacyl-[acyl-carrier-protein] synthase II [bacterium]|nr:MAG: beta-ketoacyl-[acyl-carrier-protein] synthase II [bacterium]